MAVQAKGKAVKQLGFYIDQTRCTGCYACIVACKDWHDIPAGPASWMKVSTIEKGKFPDLFVAFRPNPCYHCVDAPCVAVCPVGAITKREDNGIVVVDREKCIGQDSCGHPCSIECPAGNDVLGFVPLIKEGRYEEAWRLIVETNPLPGVCGRVCYHPCESVCIRGQVEEPISIHALERFLGEHAPATPPFIVERKSQRVAVVGSGPAGLSCAYHLARRGYGVTIFEALPVTGGMLRVGIPRYRLPAKVLDREIAFIKALGVEIKTNMRLGHNLSLKELDQFDAVFLGVGAHKQRSLNIPGENLKEVVGGLDFLREVNVLGKGNVGQRTLVLGGGNVAFNCARMARRLGANEVHLACPEAYDSIPADLSEIRESEMEGVIIHPSRTFTKILGKDGHVSGVECLRLRSMEFDVEGKLHFDAFEGSEHVLAADTVIFAIGEDLDLSFLPKEIKVDKGRILIDEDGTTSHKRFFAGGDVAVRQERVAYAIGAGRRAAQAIDRDLMGFEKQRPAEGYKEYKLFDTDFFEKKPAVAIPELPVHERRRNLSEIELGLDNEQAIVEASRCLNCRGMCLVACPYGSPSFGAEDNAKVQKCDLCLEELVENRKPVCVRACTMRALDAGPIEELRAKYGDVTEAPGFTYSAKSKPAIVFKPKVQ